MDDYISNSVGIGLDAYAEGLRITYEKLDNSSLSAIVSSEGRKSGVWAALVYFTDPARMLRHNTAQGILEDRAKLE